MFHSLARIIYTRNSYAAIAVRVFSQNASFVPKHKQLDKQTDYIKSIDDSNAQNQDWTAVKNNILSMRGNLNQKNVDAVILKIMVASRNFSAASLFAQHLKTINQELPLGSINGILHMYYAMGKENKLSVDQEQFILDTYKSLYEKYKVLDSRTCEELLHVLCVIDEWEKALKVLKDIHLSSVPTHSAYSTLVATFFRLNKKKKALELIQESVKHKRPLQDIAYEEWIKYILRKYNNKKTIAKYLDDIFEHIVTNWAVVSEKTANRFKDLYNSMDWDAQFARIRKSDGECSCCKGTLECLSLSDEEFYALQKNVKDKLIVGSDLLLKTTHDELKKFLDFVERSIPYDVVLDGLNICFALGYCSYIDRLHFLNHVVDYFVKENKKILVLGRQHMLKWNKKIMDRIMSKACFFFAENLSQDDPFFITAAILSGPHTDIVSKDLLRGHKFNLKDESLKHLFKRWQWQHQWMVFSKTNKGLHIQPPLSFTPCAQKKSNTWHLPYESEMLPPSSSSMLNDGIPDLRSWICLRQK